MRTEADIQATNKTLDVTASIDSTITWLRCDFHTRKDQIAHLLDDIRELRVLYLQKVGTLTVREAQLLRVCRICRQPYSAASFVFNCGDEFAHKKCLESGVA